MVLSKKVYLYIKEKIINNEYVSDRPISENDISKALNVSRTPVREAIIMAEKEGLVKRYSGRGTFIKEVDFKKILDIIDLRQVIEPNIISRVINKIPDEEIIEIETKLKAIKNHKIFDANEASKVGRQVHKILFKYCDNNFLKEMFDNLDMQQNIGCLVVHQYKVNALRYLDEHLLILNELKNKNSEKAKKVMFDHLSSYKKVFLNL